MISLPCSRKNLSALASSAPTRIQLSSVTCLAAISTSCLSLSESLPQAALLTHSSNGADGWCTPGMITYLAILWKPIEMFSYSVPHSVASMAPRSSMG